MTKSTSRIHSFLPLLPERSFSKMGSNLDSDAVLTTLQDPNANIIFKFEFITTKSCPDFKHPNNREVYQELTEEMITAGSV